MKMNFPMLYEEQDGLKHDHMGCLKALLEAVFVEFRYPSKHISSFLQAFQVYRTVFRRAFHAIRTKKEPLPLLKRGSYY